MEKYANFYKLLGLLITEVFRPSKVQILWRHLFKRRISVSSPYLVRGIGEFLFVFLMHVVVVV